ncbi:MAG: hypothetical protein H6867_04170 [Rhodospirillales bacterium]|nr:hypothetical protein [Rhodospirillales bacterium]MCB9996347.1 hypothetical protein [Rhodospirillales bacterium]
MLTVKDVKPAGWSRIGAMPFSILPLHRVFNLTVECDKMETYEGEDIMGSYLTVVRPGTHNLTIINRERLSFKSPFQPGNTLDLKDLYKRAIVTVAPEFEHYFEDEIYKSNPRFTEWPPKIK